MIKLVPGGVSVIANIMDRLNKSNYIHNDEIFGEHNRNGIYFETDEELVHCLLDAGAAIDAASHVGQTPLHQIADFGDREAVSSINLDDVGGIHLGLDLRYKSISRSTDSMPQYTSAAYGVSPSSVLAAHSTQNFMFPSLMDVKTSDKFTIDVDDLKAKTDSCFSDSFFLLDEDDINTSFMIQETSTKTSSSTTSSSSYSSHSVPLKPRHPLTNNFMCMLSLACILRTINERLLIKTRDGIESSYEYIKSAFTWEVTLLKGCTTARVQIQLFRDSVTGAGAREDPPPAGYIVHANRLSGCGMMFRSFYCELKAHCLARPDSLSAPPPLVLPLLAALPEARLEHTLRPVSALLTGCCGSSEVSPSLEGGVDAPPARLDAAHEAAQLLFELSRQDDMQAALVDSGCVAALVKCASTVSFTSSASSGSGSGSSPTSSSSSSPSSSITSSSGFLLPAELLLEATAAPSLALRQHAVATLANLSGFESPLAQEAILLSPDFGPLLQMILGSCGGGGGSIGSYFDAAAGAGARRHECCELRRESARVLKQLCQGHAKRVAEALGRSGGGGLAVAAWARQVDELGDERLKLHADETKVLLGPFFMAY